MYILIFLFSFLFQLRLSSTRSFHKFISVRRLQARRQLLDVILISFQGRFARENNRHLEVDYSIHDSVFTCAFNIYLTKTGHLTMSLGTSSL